MRTPPRRKWMSLLWVKLRGFSGGCVSAAGFREGFMPGGGGVNGF